MRAETVKVRHLRSIDGQPVRLPRVADPTDALTAPGWTVHTERGPLLSVLIASGRCLLAGLVVAVRCVLALVVRGLRWLTARAVPLRRCAGCGLCLRDRGRLGLVDVRSGSGSCPVTGVRHAPWAVTGRG